LLARSHICCCLLLHIYWGIYLCPAHQLSSWPLLVHTLGHLSVCHHFICADIRHFFKVCLGICTIYISARSNKQWFHIHVCWQYVHI
jgi:hypothetical protein